MKDNLGLELTEAQSDKKKIMLHVIARLSLVIIITIAGINGVKIFKSLKGIMIFSLIFIPSLIWSLYSLRYLKVKLVFCQNGFILNNKSYLYKDIGELKFYDYSNGIKVEQYMKSDKRVFNVTYIYRPKRAFNKAYLND
ncbi:MAG: hypothetical protein NC483_02030 [Ruminococcus sp.]|nr:hypothetical protein [Ruminococcus sp.]